LPEVPSGTWLATEWWLERCIKQQMLVDPNYDILSQPHLGLPIDGMFGYESVYCRLLIVSDFKGLTITTSGMGHDVLHISKLVKLAGETVTERNESVVELTLSQAQCTTKHWHRGRLS
jgi:DNA replication regulator DPB11